MELHQFLWQDVGPYLCPCSYPKLIALLLYIITKTNRKLWSNIIPKAQRSMGGACHHWELEWICSTSFHQPTLSVAVFPQSSACPPKSKPYPASPSGCPIQHMVSVASLYQQESLLRHEVPCVPSLYTQVVYLSYRVPNIGRSKEQLFCLTHTRIRLVIPPDRESPLTHKVPWFCYWNSSIFLTNNVATS